MDIFECNTGAPGVLQSPVVRKCRPKGLSRLWKAKPASAAVGGHGEKPPMVSKEGETIDTKCKK